MSRTKQRETIPMPRRLSVRAGILFSTLVPIALALPLAGCSSAMVDTLAIAPTSQSVAVGSQVSFTATGTEGHGSGHPSTTQNVTDQATWASSDPAVATISNAGVATGVSAGTTTITATITGYTGLLTATASLTVTGTGSGGSISSSVSSLSIIPSSQSVAAPGQTGQFIAIATSSVTGLQSNVTGAVTWSSSNTGVATISATGLATATGAGTTTITAIANNPNASVVTATATFTVTGASAGPLLSVSIIPGSQTMSSGQSGQLIALGTYSTIPTTQNLTTQVTWASSNPSVAAVTAGGMVTAVSQGTVVITAIASNPGGGVVTGTATFTVNESVTPEPLVSLAIVPASQTASVVGQTVQYIAIGTTSTGATVNLTNQAASINGAAINAAVWGTSSSAIATISATGLATAASSGTVAITAIAYNPDGTAVEGAAAFTVSPTPEPLVSLAIVPGSQTATEAKQPLQYVVVGTTSTGATVNLTGQPATVNGATINAATWTSSNPAVGTVVSSGIATSVANGTTAIIATAYNPDGTAVTATATLTVDITANSEPLVSLAIIPAAQTTSVVGQTVQYIAIGTTSTGSTVNLTNQAASINGAAINAAVWGTSSSAIATISSSTGIATTVSAGAAVITAQATNPDGTVVTGTSALTVISNPEPLVSIAIVPSSPTLTVAGQTVQYIAIGTTSSGATVNLTSKPATIGSAIIQPVVWASSTLSVATIGTTGVAGSNPGLAVAGFTGVTGITATAYNPDGTAVTGSSTLNVATGTSSTLTSEPIVSLAVVPTAEFGFAINQTAQYIAIGTTSTGTTVNLTSQPAEVGSANIQPAVWSSSNPQVATATVGGIVSAVSAGSTAITAAVENPDGSVVTGTAVYTVTLPTTPEPLVSIAVTPPSSTLAGGATVTLAATGTSGTGSTVTNPTVVWTSSDPGIATVNQGTGVVTAVNPGVTAITATATNPDGTTATGTSVITVPSTASTIGTISSITVIPSSQTVASPTETADFIAIGTTTTGATIDLTNSPQVVWSTSSSDIANVIQTGANAGQASAAGPGTATITALYTPTGGGNVVTGTASFTVAGGTTEEYTAVTIIPGSESLSASGQTAQLVALGTLGNTGAEQDVTHSTQITWQSSVQTVALVGPTGQVTGQSAGTTTITAELMNPDGTVVSAQATITVTNTAPPEPILSLSIIPSSISVDDFQLTGQFLAVATYSTAPYVQDVTNSPNTTWISTEPEMFPVDTNSGGNPGASAGLVTAYASGSAVIVAETSSSDGTIQTATATFSCPEVLPPPVGSTSQTPGSCYPGQPPSTTLLETLTVYNEGLNTTDWLVTAPSATDTQDVIHCGPGWTGTGGSVCTATYPTGSSVILTAPQDAGNFGGWSYNCTPSDVNGNPLPGPIYWTEGGPNYCVVTLTSNDTVGAIFN